ncbi:MAG: adenosylcobinamide-phosphate synthase CbiB [Candidatus Omnitrophota bacterium]
MYCYIADLFLGDPEWFPHPVKGVGKLINFFDNNLRGSSSKWVERLNGVILTIVVVGISTSVAYLFIEILGGLNPFLGSLAWIYLGYAVLSVKDLRVKAREVLKEVEKNSLSEAKKKLSKIVGRDTQDLNKDRIVAATIESIAESTNDGIVGPLFYLVLGGPVLAFAYKSINTLDSMVGYKNKKYLHFGWFSAKLDDAVNFIPARISGFLIAVSSAIIGGVVRQAHYPERSRRRFKESIEVMARDSNKHSSPNSGVSEAAMAGALGIRLGGPSTYQGKVFERPYLGEEKRILQPLFINEALSVSLIASILMVSAGVILRWLI